VGPWRWAPCELHVQSGATHNEFDLYGDVIDPTMAFLRRHRRGPWGAKAGGSLTITSRPTLDRPYTEVGTWLNAHRAVGGLHHESCPRVCVSNDPDGNPCELVRSPIGTLF